MSNQQNDELVESKQDAKNEKLKTYIVRYTFNGFGECETEARNEKEAEENFYDGNFDNDWSCEKIQMLGENLDDGAHLIRIELMDQKNESSNSFKFRINAVLVNGHLQNRQTVQNSQKGYQQYHLEVPIKKFN